MFILLSIISILSALCLIAIIMMQQSKTRGGLGAVSGGMAESIFGAGATSALTKGTTWIAIVFLVSTLLLAAVTGRSTIKSDLEGNSSIGALAEQKAIEAKKAEEAKKAAEEKKAEPAKPAEEKK